MLCYSIWKKQAVRKKHTPKTEYVETPSPTTLWHSVLSSVKSSPFLLWHAWPWAISGFSIFSFANSRLRSTERGTVWWSLLAAIFHTPHSILNFQILPLPPQQQQLYEQQQQHVLRSFKPPSFSTQHETNTTKQSTNNIIYMYTHVWRRNQSEK